MNFNEAVNYIMDIPKFGAIIDGRNKTGNDNLMLVMERLGNPQKSCKSIHIAGTNGKGSTVQLIKSILNEKGYRVGTFTSPHLINITERISIDSDIDEESFLEAFNQVKAVVDELVNEGKPHLSFFEFIFAMAAMYFEKEMPDYVVYETGLGGRLDATNILKPVITVITSIGLDHTMYLGDTIRDIAFEKAGIIKERTPVIFNTGDREADAVINARAELLDAEAINVAKTEYIINDLTDKTIDFSVYNSYYKYDNIILPVSGALYQVDNAMTAIVACNCLLGQYGWLDSDTIQNALSKFFWPGRMEKIHPNIIVDGAHNPDAISRFVECVKVNTFHGNVKLLFAVAGDKDYEPMIINLCEELDISEVYVTSLNSDRGISAEYIAALFKMYLSKRDNSRSCKIVVDDDIRKTFTEGFKSAVADNDILYCVGSLYLIGSIKEIAMEVFDND